MQNASILIFTRHCLLDIVSTFAFPEKVSVMSSFEVPEGHSEPFLVVTPSDKSAWIIIATAFGLTFVLLFGIIRVCVRLTIAPPFGLDDIFQGCSTVGLL